jgi:hypothetical protein
MSNAISRHKFATFSVEWAWVPTNWETKHEQPLEFKSDLSTNTKTKCALLVQEPILQPVH